MQYIYDFLNLKNIYLNGKPLSITLKDAKLEFVLTIL